MRPETQRERVNLSPDELGEHLTREAHELARRFPGSKPDLSRLADERMAVRSARLRRAVLAAAVLLALGAGVLSLVRGETLVGPVAVMEDESTPRSLIEATTVAPMSVAEETTAPAPAAPSTQGRVYAVVITAPDGQGGQQTVATGYYFPPQVEQVDFQELGPSERYAVQAALGDDARYLPGPGI